MKKTIICFLVFVLLIRISLANIIISYPSIHVVTKDQTKAFNITIENNNTFGIYNVQFTPATYFTFPAKFNLTSNSSTSANVNLTATSAFALQSFATIFSFNTITTTTREPATKQLHINRTSISNNNLQIFKNDMVRFFNNDTINLTIKRNDSIFLFTIPSLSFVDKNFTSIETFNYFVEESVFIGSIDIQDNTIQQFAHDPSLDQTLTFAVTSNNKQTNLALNLILNNFVANHNSTIDSVLLLESNETILKVNLSASKWVEFNENFFDFTERKLVNYKIKPNINDTNETDKLHTITITARADNAQEVSSPLNIFINKHDFSQFSSEKDNKTINFIFADESAIIAFCKVKPLECLKNDVVAEYCRVNPEVCPKQEVFKNRSLTQEGQFLEDIKNTGERALNRMTTIQEEKLPALEGKITDANSRLATLEEKQNQAEDEEKARLKAEAKARFWRITIWVLAIIASSGIVGFFYFRDKIEDLSDI